MPQAARIRRNSLFAFLSQVIRLVTNFLLFVGIARLYGVEAFGQFTTAHTLSAVFLLFADFGFDILVAMEIARNRGHAVEIARRYFSQKIVFAGAATLAMLVLSFVQDFTWQTRTLVQIFALYVFGASLNNFFFALFKGFEEFHHETRISFWINGTLLGLLLVLGILHVPLQFIALAFVLTRVMGVLLASRVAGRLSGGSVMHLTFSRWRETWGTVAVFGMQFLFGSLFFLLDTILLSFWRGDRDVGIYQSAFKIMTLALIVPDIAVNTMIPVLARLHADGDQRWSSLGKLLNKTLTLLALPVSLVLFVYPEVVIQLLYGGGEFAEAVPILRIFSLTVFVRFAVDAYGIMLTTSNRQTVRMFIVMGGTLVNFLLNAYMIPRYGPWGAAIVSLATNILVGAGYVIGSGQSFFRWSCEWKTLAVIAVTAVTAAVAWNVRAVPVWITVPAALALVGAALALLGFSRDELKMITATRSAIDSRPAEAEG